MWMSLELGTDLSGRLFNDLNDLLQGRGDLDLRQGGLAGGEAERRLGRLQEEDLLPGPQVVQGDAPGREGAHLTIHVALINSCERATIATL